jgi:hypothetical protein
MNDPERNSDGLYQCERCHTTFKLLGKFKRHDCSNKDVWIAPTHDAHGNEYVKGEDGKYSCAICNAKFSRIRSIVEHVCATNTSAKLDLPQCTHCGKIFRNPDKLLTHSCDKMVRHNRVINTAVGRKALLLFQLWVRIKTKMSKTMISVESFIASRFCQTFLNFVEWSTKTNLPDVEKYINTMVSWKFEPNMWMMDQVYVKYIDFIDRTASVDDHVRNTFNTLSKIASAADCDVNQAIHQLEVNQLMVLVRARKISPWVLLKMNGFQQIYGSLSTLQKSKLIETIVPNYWKEKFVQFPDETSDIVEFVKRLGL